MTTREQLENWFSYHAPVDDDLEKYRAIRTAGLEFARALVEINAKEREAEASEPVADTEELLVMAQARFATRVRPLLPEVGTERDRSESVAMIRELVMWANAAIACRAAGTEDEP